VYRASDPVQADKGQVFLFQLLSCTQYLQSCSSRFKPIPLKWLTVKKLFKVKIWFQNYTFINSCSITIIVPGYLATPLHFFVFGMARSTFILNKTLEHICQMCYAFRGRYTLQQALWPWKTQCPYLEVCQQKFIILPNTTWTSQSTE